MTMLILPVKAIVRAVKGVLSVCNSCVSVFLIACCAYRWCVCVWHMKYWLSLQISWVLKVYSLSLSLSLSLSQYLFTFSQDLLSACMHWCVCAYVCVTFAYPLKVSRDFSLGLAGGLAGAFSVAEEAPASGVDASCSPWTWGRLTATPGHCVPVWFMDLHYNALLFCYNCFPRPQKWLAGFFKSLCYS